MVSPDTYSVEENIMKTIVVNSGDGKNRQEEGAGA